MRFVEDHENPPSRAYLKLWEAFTVAGCRPRPGDRCVDLGSSPGGWTWALERWRAGDQRGQGADRSALTWLTRVRYVKDSAFAIDPASVGRVDWMLSTVICYPERSARLIERWLAAHPRASFVVTIKLQGETDPAPLRDLAAIEDATLVHLPHNSTSSPDSPRAGVDQRWRRPAKPLSPGQEVTLAGCLRSPPPARRPASARRTTPPWPPRTRGGRAAGPSRR